jgi:hypothetical protein
VPPLRWKGLGVRWIERVVMLVFWSALAFAIVLLAALWTYDLLTWACGA